MKKIVFFRPTFFFKLSSPAFVTQVVIRVRPPLPREVDGERMFQNIVSVDKDEHVITISENLNAILDEVSARVAFEVSGTRKGL